jgi:hypothetical protein
MADRGVDLISDRNVGDSLVHKYAFQNLLS